MKFDIKSFILVKNLLIDSQNFVLLLPDLPARSELLDPFCDFHWQPSLGLGILDAKEIEHLDVLTVGVAAHSSLKGPVVRQVEPQHLQSFSHHESFSYAYRPFDDERLLLLALDSMVDEFSDR
jgi:hypothetical protein